MLASSKKKKKNVQVNNVINIFANIKVNYNFPA